MDHGHGGYTNHGCRCEICRTAARTYQKRYQVAYRELHKEKKNGYKRTYYKAKGDELRAKERSPAGKDSKRVRENARRARKLDQFVEDVDHRIVYEMHGGCCGICKEFIGEDNFHVDHIIPLVQGGQHSYANSQPAHPFCNISKGGR